MDKIPDADLSTLPILETPLEELDAAALELVNNINRLQKEVSEQPKGNSEKGQGKKKLGNEKLCKEKLDKKLDAAMDDDSLLADHRADRRKLAERLEKDPDFRKVYELELMAKNLAEDEIGDNIEDSAEYIDALTNELTEEDIAALGDLHELGGIKPTETVNVTKALKEMGIVFQNVTTVNIYMCNCKKC